MTDEIKIYKISGKYYHHHQHFVFTKYIRALKEPDAQEIVISTISSQGVFRRKIHLTESKVISLDECPDLYIHELADLS